MGIMRGAASTFLCGVFVGPLLIVAAIWGLVRLLPVITGALDAITGAAL